MKRIQRQIILITITLLFIITTCCSVSAAKIDNDTQLSANTSISPVNTSVVISGNVKRCSNGDNFQGVTVTAFKNGVELESTTTKADGTYTLDFKSADKVFTVTASYPGHKSASKTVTVNNNSIGTSNFQLGMDSVYVSPAGSDTTGIGTAGAPYQTIQKGLDNVNPGGTVYIANGTYTLMGGFSISKDVHIVGASQENTILKWCTFHIYDPINFTVANLTMTNFYFNAIRNMEGNCRIINCTFTDSRRTDYSPIYNLGTCYIVGCTFTGNNASRVSDYEGGGAICNYGTITTIRNCIFSGNTAINGGAIWNCRTIGYIIGCTFTGNSATGVHGTGGAICNQGTIDYMNGCTFTGNFATGTRGADGGAIANVNYGKMEGGSAFINVVSDCTFMDNSAIYGGAVFNSGSYIVLRDCSFTGNNANNGTDIFNIRGTVVAEYNWWGSSSGPSSNQVYGVQINKWLKEPIGLGLGTVDPNSNSSNGNHNTVNAASTTETVGLQNTGIPLNYLLLAVLMVLSGLATFKKS